MSGFDRQRDGGEGHGQTDVRLVAGVRAGREADRAEFARRLRFLPAVVRKLNAKLPHPLPDHDLDDVAQESVLGALGKLERFDGSARLESWVTGFAYLSLVARVRKRTVDADALRGFDRPSPADRGGTAFEVRLDHEVVLRALDELEPALARIVRLKAFRSLTFEEVALEVGAPSSSVKTRYYRALQELRRRLAPRFCEGRTAR